MAHGIAIGTDIDNHFGVLKKFVIFNRETFLTKIKDFYESQSEEVVKCNDNTVSGYMSGLIHESGTRLYRDFDYRKTQVGPEHPEVLFDF